MLICGIVYCVCGVYVCACECSEDNFVDFAISFHLYMCYRDYTCINRIEQGVPLSHEISYRPL